jgi:purine-binding chemotaxis protein CheW
MKSTELATGDYLIFTSGTGHFALPSSCVQEILYPHAVTPLPFVPPSVDGLINVEGSIAVQVNFSHLHGQAHHKGKELVLIDTGRALCALKVDEVRGRLSLQRQNIHPFITDEYTKFHAEIDNIEADFFIGTTTHDGMSILIVDHERIGQLVQAGNSQQEGSGILGKVESYDDMEEDMHISCLVVSFGKDRYAFELEGITEIIEAGACTAIPDAPGYLKGFHLVREQAMLVIDLLTIIAQPDPDTEKRWVIIIERDNFRYGFLVEAIEGIVNFPLESYEPVVDSGSNLSGLFVYQDKSTALLSPRRIVDDTMLETLSQYATSHSEENTLITEESERYLQVSICEAPYAIPIENVNRISQFFPMEEISNADESIRGAINMDGSIIPVLALEKSLALKCIVDQGEYVIVGNGQQEWAVCVDLAQGIVEVPKSQINRMTYGNSRYVSGVAHIDDKLVPVLDFSILKRNK